MINNNELRYGNWVECYCHTFRIGIIEEFTVEPIGRNEGGFPFEDLNPIPLSADILLKAGFEKYQEDNHNGFIYGDTPIYCHWDGVEFVFQYAIDADLCFAACEFVHQLQNLMFCLIGKELQITLSP